MPVVAMVDAVTAAARGALEAELPALLGSVFDRMTLPTHEAAAPMVQSARHAFGQKVLPDAPGAISPAACDEDSMHCFYRAQAGNGP